MAIRFLKNQNLRGRPSENLMSKKSKNKVPINTEASGFNDAFGGLSLEGLPSATQQEPTAIDTAGSPKRDCCLRRETAHRGGKAVVVIYQFPKGFGVSELKALAKSLKQYCGTGGTVKDGEVVIQGEKVDEVRQYLESNKWSVRGV